MEEHRNHKKQHGKQRHIKPEHEGGRLGWMSKLMNGFLATLVIIQYSNFVSITLSTPKCDHCIEDGAPDQLSEEINQRGVSRVSRISRVSRASRASRASTSDSAIAVNATRVTRPLHDSKTKDRSRVFIKLDSPPRKWQWGSVVASNTTDNQNRTYPVVATDVGELVDDQNSIYKMLTEREAANILNYERRDQPPARVNNCCQRHWSGDTVDGDVSSYNHLSLIVSYCKTPLNWIEQYMEGYIVANVTIISKCGKPVEGAPNNATIVELPNVGRCDHAYAYWVMNWIEMQQQRYKASDYKFADHAMIFLKDTRPNFNIAGIHRSLNEMLRISSSNGFGCGTILNKHPASFLSAYTFVNDIKTYNNKITYNNSGGVAYGDLGVKQAPFPSVYANVNEWWNYLGVERLPAYRNDHENETLSIKGEASSADDLVQACYKGNFVVRGSNLYRQDLSVWKKMEEGLRRGDNIEEGHLQERSWGPLLADVLSKTIRDELLAVKDGKVDVIYVGHLAVNDG